MSLRYEQYRSLQMTQQLMFDLLKPRFRPKTIKELRIRVLRCIRHFPFLDTYGKPMFSTDNFALPVPPESDRNRRRTRMENRNEAAEEVPANPPRTCSRKGKASRGYSPSKTTANYEDPG